MTLSNLFQTHFFLSILLVNNFRWFLQKSTTCGSQINSFSPSPGCSFHGVCYRNATGNRLWALQKVDAEQDNEHHSWGGGVWRAMSDHFLRKRRSTWSGTITQRYMPGDWKAKRLKAGGWCLHLKGGKQAWNCAMKKEREERHMSI